MDIAGGRLYCVMATSPMVGVLGADAVGVGGSEPEHEERTNAVKAKATKTKVLIFMFRILPSRQGGELKPKGIFLA